MSMSNKHEEAVISGSNGLFDPGFNINIKGKVNHEESKIITKAKTNTKTSFSAYAQNLCFPDKKLLNKQEPFFAK